MTTESIEQFLKRGGKIKHANKRKAKGYVHRTKLKAAGHMNTKKETHAWWSDTEVKSESL